MVKKHGSLPKSKEHPLNEKKKNNKTCNKLGSISNFDLVFFPHHQLQLPLL